jgi:hypothetical protein
MDHGLFSAAEVSWDKIPFLALKSTFKNLLARDDQEKFQRNIYVFY